MDCVWYNMMSCFIFLNLSVYYIVGVMLLYVVCKGTGYWGQSLAKSKCEYEPNCIMKHVDVTGNLLHCDLSCWYVCMKSNEV